MSVPDPGKLSPRLATIYRVLARHRLSGITTKELFKATGSMAPATDVADLRKAGFSVMCQLEPERTGQGRKVYRYWLTKGEQ